MVGEDSTSAGMLASATTGAGNRLAEALGLAHGRSLENLIGDNSGKKAHRVVTDAAYRQEVDGIVFGWLRHESHPK